MGFVRNLFLLTAYILIVHYGTVSARTCFKGLFEEDYHCPDNMFCCEDDRCCSFSDYYSAFYSFVTVALLAFAFITCCCMLCSCCCRRRQDGVIYSSGTSTVVQLPPPSVPQGYPGYSSVHPPFPTNQGAYNPYWGLPPPEYQAAVTAPTPPPLSTSHIVPVVPVASAPPAN